jgi:MFS family permease
MKQIFVSLFIAVAVAMIGVGIIAPILPLYAKSFAASGLSIGVVFSAFSLSRSLLGPLVGRLSDRVGRKRILMMGLAGYTVVSLLYVVAMSLWQLGLFRLLQGAASVMVTPIAQAYIGDITPPGKLLGGGLSALWSYQIPFYAMGALSFIALLLVARAVPADHRESEAGQNRPQEIAPMRDVLKNDAVKGICVYVATRGFWRQGFNTFYPLYAVAASGLGEASIGTVLSVYMLGGGLLQIPFGFLPPLLLLAIPFVHKMWMVILITFAMGAFSALSRASVIAIRTELGRRHGMGTLTGLQGGAFAVGQMLGPLAYGAVADLVGLVAVFPFGSAIGLLGTGFVVGWFRRWERAGKPI